MNQSQQIVCILGMLASVSVFGSGCATSRSDTSQRGIAAWRQSTGQPSEFTQGWNDWADRNLQDGDLIFMRGDCYVLMNTVNFSDLSTDLTDSRFSHIGLVAIEDGHAYVYDIRNKGCIRTRFAELIGNRHLHQVAIKRNREMSQEQLAETARFCRAVFDRREKFDSQFQLDNDRYYCAELVEAAYRCEGHPLSEPIPIRDLPNYQKHATQLQMIRPVAHITPDQAVILPGNDQIGIWANPELDLILDLPDTKVRPPKGD